MNYGKRTETSVVTKILEYLQCLENSGTVIWCDRLNSGNIPVSYKSKVTGKTKFRRIRLCREGTPDIICFLHCGLTLWIEVKLDGEKQSDKQIEFEKMVNYMPNHRYFIAHDVDESAKIIKDILDE